MTWISEKIRSAIPLAVGCALLALCAAPAAAQSVVPLEAYARLPHVQSVSISPNGERLGMITGAERDEMYAIVVGVDGQGQLVLPGFSTDINDGLLMGIGWLSDRFVLITYRSRVRVPGGSLDDADIAKRIIYDLQDGSHVELAPNATIVSILPQDPDRILVSAQVVTRGASTSVAQSRGASETARVINLYEYELSRDNYRRIAQGTPQTVNWVLGDDFQPIIRQDLDARNSRIRVFAYQGRRSSLIYEESYTTERFGRSGRRPLSRIGRLSGVDHGDRGVWFDQMENRDFNRAWLFDPATGEIRSGDIDTGGFDFGGFRTDWRTGRVIGATWQAERLQTEWFDPVFAGLQSQLNEIFPLADVRISDWDLSGQRLIVQVIGGDTSLDYYMLDRSSGEMSFLATQYPEIPPGRIHPMEIVRYEAEDGLPLWGYLTRPIDREARNLPMIVLPHGGPQARDYYGFDIWAQPLADMGYAVFQPQFRGSSGQGMAFVRRGHGEWGRSMQGDISAAVRHFTNEGVADPDRVCIFGWSYGGYAALAGHTLTPELYRCAIAGAPVSDIIAMMRYEQNRMGGASVNYWTEYIGDWRNQRSQMVAISPAQQAGSARAPLLLIHGREDLIVPYDQAQIMYDAAQQAGVPVQIVTIEGDGHNLLFRRTRQITIDAIARFLMEHNPPDPR